MGYDASLDVRKAVVDYLAVDENVAALFASQLYGPQVPADVQWPYLRIGLPLASPFLSTCNDGSRIELTVNLHIKAVGDDLISSANALIVRTLDDTTIVLDETAKLRIYWLRSQVVRDTTEAGAWHGINVFDSTVVKNRS